MPLQTYAGLPILTVLPDFPDGGELTTATEIEGEVADNDGGAFLLDMRGTDEARTIPLEWTCRTRAEYAAVREFLDAMQGRAGAFWCPSMVHDFDALAVGMSAMIVRSWGWAAYVWPKPRWRHFALYKKNPDGTMTGAGFVVSGAPTVNPADPAFGGVATETYGIFTGLTGEWAGRTTRQGLMATQIMVARLAEDTVRERWLAPELCVVTARAAWRVEETPEG